jgi:hypothetical protein
MSPLLVNTGGMREEEILPERRESVDAAGAAV